MDDGARGEAMERIVLHDEDGQAFAFLPLRVIPNRSDLFLIAERDGAGTIHELSRADGRLGLVGIEPIADERFLADLYAHLENPGRRVGSAS